MELVDRALAGDGEAFRELVAPYQRELHVHCYRMLGSVQDAEDALQDTLLSAWQGLAGYEGRASLRTWLYRVATSRCLDALRTARRQPRAAAAQPAAGTPADANGPAADDPAMASMEPPEPTRLGEVLWLEPYPDDLLTGLPDSAPGPEARYESAESISLAFITAMQLLPPRQRAALILRDVLGFRASETAQQLNTTEESVTSALKRARATLDRQQPTAVRGSPAPAAGSAAERDVVRQLTEAFASGDVNGIVALLTGDVLFTMPPLPLEYQGRELAGRFLAATALRPGWTATLVESPVRANGQPAFGFYASHARTGQSHTVGLLVLTLSGDRISALTRFDSAMLSRFGLPASFRFAR